jgi:Mg2+-importing ATPase
VKWDIGLIERFMLVFGPISSLFDILTFYVLLKLLGAGEFLFQTGWFIESLMTQVLVVFANRTRGSLFNSKSHLLLVSTALGVLALAIMLPFSPLGGWIGFVAPPRFFVYLVGATIVYLGVVEAVKKVVYRVAASR